jgi:hypothetical protein
MEFVRYRPGEAIRWLQTGGENYRRVASVRGKAAAAAPIPDAKKFGENLVTAASAFMDFSRGAYADLMHRQADASEYVLHDSYLEIVRGPNIRTIPYEKIASIELDRDKATLKLDPSTTITIRPFAHLVAGRVKVPIGWSRNGIEVPFELIVEEIAARCGLEIAEL